MPVTSSKTMLTRHEAAAFCQMHPCTLDRARKAGELRAFVRDRLVRYSAADLQRWLDSHSVGGGE